MFFRIALLLLLSAIATAQSKTAPEVNNDFLHQQFGDSCNLDAKWPPMTGDLNGDGVEDLVMIARCKNPLIDQDDKGYKVVDPMDSFYGYGNPKITAGGFGQDDPKLKGICVMIIHGAGGDVWHSAAPQAKFVIINLAVKSVAVRKMKVSKKKTETAIYVEEATGDQMTSVLYWDGRKYRYNPLGSGME
ncbi:MAG TPA: hypothetical protein VGL74_11340 [Terriglobales bacterium]|jgi:hypothetical protein